MEQVTRCGNEMGFNRVMVFIVAIICQLNGASMPIHISSK